MISCALLASMPAVAQVAQDRSGSIHLREGEPNATMALVTLLVYSFALHGKALGVFRTPKAFHAFCIVAFLCVLITYFGVNLLLGRMHSYA